MDCDGLLLLGNKLNMNDSLFIGKVSRRLDLSRICFASATCVASPCCFNVCLWATYYLQYPTRCLCGLVLWSAVAAVISAKLALPTAGDGDHDREYRMDERNADVRSCKDKGMEKEKDENEDGIRMKLGMTVMRVPECHVNCAMDDVNVEEAVPRPCRRWSNFCFFQSVTAKLIIMYIPSILFSFDATSCKVVHWQICG